MNNVAPTAPRTLIYVPVLHSLGDMGSLAAALPSPPGYGDQVDAYWAQVSAEIIAMPTSWQGVRVYQDALPLTSEEILAHIVSEVHSPNYDLLRWLQAHGAQLMGTEDPKLLLEEYHLVQASARGDRVAKTTYAARAPGLLAERDAYIAGRISTTLEPGQRGVLFLGMQHDATSKLSQDTRIVTLRACHEVVAALHARRGTPQFSELG